MSLILTSEHAFAAGIREAKIIGKFVASKALPFLKDVEAAEPTVEGITALVCPSLINIERTGEALLAKAIVAIEAAEKAEQELAAVLALAANAGTLYFMFGDFVFVYVISLAVGAWFAYRIASA